MNDEKNWKILALYESLGIFSSLIIVDYNEIYPPESKYSMCFVDFKQVQHFTSKYMKKQAND